MENTVSETTETYRDGIRAYFEGDRDTAVAELTEVLEKQPANGLAETYLAKAKKLPAPAEPADDSVNWVGWGALAGGVVAAIVGGLTALMFVLRKVRRRTPAIVTGGQQSPAVGNTAGQPEMATQPQSTFRPVTTGFAPSATPVTVPGPDGSAGSVATATIPTAAYCTTCGNGVDAGTSYCSACGARNLARG